MKYKSLVPFRTVAGCTEVRQDELTTNEKKIKDAGFARIWVVPRINTFVPVRLMTGAIFFFTP